MLARASLVVAALTLILLALGEPSVAHASPSARLVFSRTPDAASCPDEGALRRAVAERVGYDPFFPHAPLTVVAEMSRSGEDLVARVHLVDASSNALGTRELRSSQRDCAELFRALALAISIAIDPRINASPPPPIAARAAATPEPSTPTAPPIESPPAIAPDATRVIGANDTLDERPPRSSLTTYALSFGGGTSFGVAPSTAVGASLGLELRRGRWSIEVEARADLPASTHVEGGTVGAWQASGALLPCGRVAVFFACAVGVLGRFEGTGSDVSRPSHASAIHALAGARLGAELPLADRFWIRVHADGLANLNRPTLRLDGVDRWTAPLLGASVGVALAYHFP